MPYLNPGAQETLGEILQTSHTHIKQKDEISSLADYYSEYTNTNSPPYQPPTERERSSNNEISLAELTTLFRCFPAKEQPYMYLTINPGGGTELEQALLAATRGDVEQIAGITRNFLIGDYLSGKGKFKKLLEELSDVATEGDLASMTDPTEYLQINQANDWISQADAMVNLQDPKTSELVIEWMEKNPQEGVQIDSGFFNDFYYSVSYKLASSGYDDLSPKDKKLPEEYIIDEIKTVDPEIIICSGNLPWERVYPHMKDIEPIGESTIDGGIDASRGSVFRTKIAGKPRHVVAIKHPTTIYSRKISDPGDLIDNVEQADIF